MIVRRIAAGTAAAALLATGFMAGPASAKSKGQTDLKLDKGLVNALGAASVGVSANKGAKLSQQGVVSFPVTSVKGNVINHKGAFKLTASTGFVSLEKIAINYKTGKATASVGNPVTPDPLVIKNILVIKGGKNKIKKEGTWKNATASLAKSVDALGAKQDPASLMATVLGLPEGSIPTGQVLGKINIKLK